MVESFFIFLQSSLFPLGGWGVFFASIIEEVIAPIPSTLVLLGSGALFLPQTTHFYQVLFFTIVIPASLGITVGSLFVYGLSWYVSKAFILRWGWVLGFTEQGVVEAQKKISRGASDEVSLFLLRAIPIIPSVVISAASGLLRIPLKTFVSMTFLGTIPRAAVLAIIGWKAGETYELYAQKISSLENLIIVSLLVIFLMYVVFRLINYKRKKDSVIL